MSRLEKFEETERLFALVRDDEDLLQIVEEIARRPWIAKAVLKFALRLKLEDDSPEFLEELGPAVKLARARARCRRGERRWYEGGNKLGGRRPRIPQIEDRIRAAWRHLARGRINWWIEDLARISKSFAQSTVYKALKRLLPAPARGAVEIEFY